MGTVLIALGVTFMVTLMFGLCKTAKQADERIEKMQRKRRLK